MEQKESLRWIQKHRRPLRLITISTTYNLFSRDPLNAPSSAVNSALFAQDRPILDAPRLRFYGLWHSKSANFNVYKHLFNLSREDVQLSKVIVLKKPERGTFQAILKGYFVHTYYCWWSSFWRTGLVMGQTHSSWVWRLGFLEGSGGFIVRFW